MVIRFCMLFASAYQLFIVYFLFAPPFIIITNQIVLENDQ